METEERVPWDLLCREGDGRPQCMGSGPDNTLCKVKTRHCSAKLAPQGDLCYWHWCRMGDVAELRCGCRTWKTACGDSTGRMLTRRYYADEEFASVDIANRFYCCGTCQSRDNYVAQCGQMFVCPDCVESHCKTSLVRESDSEEDEEEQQQRQPWPHCDLYRKKFAQYVDTNPGTYWRVVALGPCGPEDAVFDPVYALLPIRDAQSAILASRLDPTHRLWFEWLAGWYDDCPPSLVRHIQ